MSTTSTLPQPSKSPRPAASAAPIADERTGTHVRLDVDLDTVLQKLRKVEKSAEKRKQYLDSLKGLPKKERKLKRFTADTADRHELYQLSVQSPEEDAQFLHKVYKKSRGKVGTHFREDFSGTCILSKNWITRGKEYTAEGFDIDPDPIAWGLYHNFRKLGASAERMLIHQKDVREPSTQAPDIRCAQNFSYWIFKTREEMLGYFKTVLEDLADDGVFVVDLHGGPESIEELEEEREIDEGFTYVWDQDGFAPISGDLDCRIHFRFEDGTEMKNAFRYTWRMWFLTELRDVLTDAGFQSVDCYWEGTDEDGESGNGVFKKEKKGENCLSYIAYLVALK